MQTRTWSYIITAIFPPGLAMSATTTGPSFGRLGRHNRINWVYPKDAVSRDEMTVDFIAVFGPEIGENEWGCKS
jgi:hypothetical protein